MLECLDLVRRDLTDDADTEPRPGEGLSLHDVVGEAELGADLPDFILEEAAERLDQLELHVLGQATHIVMALDRGGVLASRLDDIGIQRSLHKELGAATIGATGRFGLGILEDPDEEFADRLALGLGLGDAGEGGEEALRGIDEDQPHTEVLLKRLDDLVGLVQAHQAGIDMHTGELIADGLVHERSSNRGINTTGQRTDDRLVADLLADLLDRGVDDRGHGPVARRAAPFAKEALDHMLAVLGVHDFRVELHAVELAFCRLERSDGGVGGGGRGRDTVRRHGDGVEMRHPDVLLGGGARQQGAAVALDGEGGAAVLAPIGAADRAAILLGDQLRAVADAENRNVEVVHGRIDGDSSVGVHGIGAAAEDDAGGRLRRDLGGGGAGRDDLAVDVGFSYPTGDQLGVLGAEVDDQHLVELTVGTWRCAHRTTTSGCEVAVTSVRPSTDTRVCSVPQSGSYARRAVVPRSICTSAMSPSPFPAECREERSDASRREGASGAASPGCVHLVGGLRSPTPAFLMRRSQPGPPRMESSVPVAIASNWRSIDPVAPQIVSPGTSKKLSARGVAPCQVQISSRHTTSLNSSASETWTIASTSPGDATCTFGGDSLTAT